MRIRAGQVDLSLVVNIFREGNLIHPTLASLDQNIAEVVSRGRTAEVVLVLDRTDRGTIDYLDEHLGNFFAGVPVHELTVENGDLGLSRNSGTRYSRGRYIAFTDDDNLYSRNWLADSLDLLESSADRQVLHPEYIVQFGARNLLWRTRSSDDPDFDVRSLIENNHWDAAAIGPREVFESVPYVATLAGPGFGPEDWHFHAESLALGWSHRPSPGTAMFYRVKDSGSLLSTLGEAGALLPPTSLFESALPQAGPPTDPVEPSAVSDEGPRTRRRFDGPRGALLAGARAAGRGVARPVRRISRVHPRLERFTDSVLPAFRELLSPPQRTPLGPAVHTGLIDIGGRVQIPDWLLAAWREIHELEPAIYPDSQTLGSMLVWGVAGGPYTEVYWELAEQLGAIGTIDYLFLVPWLAPGGATTVVHNLIAAIRDRRPTARIVVLSTSGSPGDSPGSGLAGVEFLDMPAAFHWLPAVLQDRILGTAIVQLAPGVVHLVNSPHGYRVFRSFARQLATRTRLYVSLFTIDQTSEGRQLHWVLEGIRDYAPYLRRIMVDNQPLADRMVRLFGLPPALFTVVHQPAGEGVTPIPESALGRLPDGGVLRVLWAARLDRQKRPDLLAGVSLQLRAMDAPVQVSASGAAVLDDDPDRIAHLEQAGVQYLGPYERTIASLPGTFDVLLLTSQWEGLPLTLLDAALNGLTIVVPAVGGIPDFVEDGRTGYLIERYDDVERYAALLQHLATHPEDLLRTRKRAYELALRRHSAARLLRTLRSIEGYLA